MIAHYERHGMVQMAARMGKVFGLDPFELLNGTMHSWMLRVAAYRVVQEDERKEAEKQKSEAKRGGGGRRSRGRRR